MKLIQTQLKHIFIDNQTIFFARIEKLNSKELLAIKQKLFRENIKFKFVSNKELKRFFSNFKDKTILNLFKGEIILLFSKNLDWLSFYNVLKSSFFQAHFYCLYTFNRFFFLSNLITRNKDSNILLFLKHRLYNDLLQMIFLINHRTVNLMRKQLTNFLNILEKLRYGK